MFHTANVAEQSLVTTGHSILHAVLIIVFAFFACIALAVRIWSRRIQRLALISSDYVTILGLIFALADAGITLYSLLACCLPATWKYGDRGSPLLKTLSFKIKPPRPQLQFVSPIIWALAVTTVRIAVILLYVHMFPSRPFRATCIGVMIFNAAFLIATIFAECLICQPLSYRWDLSIEGASCGDEQALTTYTGGLNLLQDVIVVFLPMPVLWGLPRMTPHKKLGVTCMFGLGIVICAVTSYRVYASSILTNPRRTNGADCDLGVLTTLEALLGIITACLPMARPVVGRVWMSLPSRGREKVLSITTKVAWLSLPSFGHGSRSWDWFPPEEGKEGYEEQESHGGGKSMGSRKGE
ncbi:MAG: hypothetical protein Q9195_005248 [Heterodermia aff. obscurata]